MLRGLTYIVTIALLLAVLFASNGWGIFGGGADHVSQASSVVAAPAPTATYVSELGPAVMQPPRQPAGLPASGAGANDEGAPWSPIAGVGLALVGAALVHFALRLRPSDV